MLSITGWGAIAGEQLLWRGQLAGQLESPSTVRGLLQFWIVFIRAGFRL